MANADANLEQAVTANNWHIVISLCKRGKNKPSQKAVSDALRQAWNAGNIEAVSFLCQMQGENKPDKEAISYVLQQAAKAERSMLITVLSSMNGDNKPSQEAVSKAVHSLAFNITKKNGWILRNLCGLVTENKPDQEAISYALERAWVASEFEIVKFLCTMPGENKPNNKAVAYVFKQAVLSGQVDLVKTLCEMKTDNKRSQHQVSQELCSTVMSDSPHKWAIIEHLCRMEGENKPDQEAISYVLKQAWDASQFDIVAFLCAIPGENKPNNEAVAYVLEQAVLSGQVELVKTLCQMETDNKPSQHQVSQALCSALLSDSPHKWAIIEHLCRMEGENKPDQEAISDVLKQAWVASEFEIAAFLCAMPGENKPNNKTVAYVLEQAALSGQVEWVKTLSQMETDNKPSQHQVSQALYSDVLSDSPHKWAIIEDLCRMDGENKPNERALEYALQLAEYRSIELRHAVLSTTGARKANQVVAARISAHSATPQSTVSRNANKTPPINAVLLNEMITQIKALAATHHGEVNRLLTSQHFGTFLNEVFSIAPKRVQRTIGQLFDNREVMVKLKTSKPLQELLGEQVEAGIKQILFESNAVVVHDGGNAVAAITPQNQVAVLEAVFHELSQMEGLEPEDRRIAQQFLGTIVAMAKGAQQLQRGEKEYATYVAEAGDQLIVVSVPLDEMLKNPTDAMAGVLSTFIEQGVTTPSFCMQFTSRREAATLLVAMNYTHPTQAAAWSHEQPHRLAQAANGALTAVTSAGVLPYAFELIAQSSDDMGALAQVYGVACSDLEQQVVQAMHELGASDASQQPRAYSEPEICDVMRAQVTLQRTAQEIASTLSLLPEGHALSALEHLMQDPSLASKLSSHRFTIIDSRLEHRLLRPTLMANKPSPLAITNAVAPVPKQARPSQSVRSAVPQAIIGKPADPVLKKARPPQTKPSDAVQAVAKPKAQTRPPVVQPVRQDIQASLPLTQESRNIQSAARLNQQALQIEQFANQVMAENKKLGKIIDQDRTQRTRAAAEKGEIVALLQEKRALIAELRKTESQQAQQIAALSSTVDTLRKQQLPSQSKKEQTTIAQLRQEKTALEAENDRMRQARDQVQDRYSRLDTVSKRILSAYSQKIVELKAALEAAEQSQRKKFDQLARKMASLSQEKTELKAAETALRQEVTQLQQRVASLSQEKEQVIAQLTQEKTILEAEKEEQRQKADQLQQQLDSFSQEREQVIAQLGQEKTILAAEKEEQRQKADQLQQQLDSFSRESEQTITQLTQKEAVLAAEKEGQRQEVAQLQQRVDSLSQEKEQVIAQLTQKEAVLAAEKEEQRQKADQWQQQVDSLSQEKEQVIAQLTQEKTELEAAERAQSQKADQWQQSMTLLSQVTGLAVTQLTQKIKAMGSEHETQLEQLQQANHQLSADLQQANTEFEHLLSAQAIAAEHDQSEAQLEKTTLLDGMEQANEKLFCQQQLIADLLDAHDKRSGDLNIQKERFDAFLDSFEALSNVLQVKKAADSIYSDAAEIAEDVGQTLRQAGQRFFANPTPETFADFKALCKESMAAAGAELSQHRDIWPNIHPIFRGIMGVLATLTVVPALMVGNLSNQGYFGTFFKTYATASATQLSQVQSKFEEIEEAIAVNIQSSSPAA